MLNKIKNTKTMKSLLFKSAWAIFKMQGISFSEALKKAWEVTKDGQKATILKCNKLVKSAGIGFDTVYFFELVFSSIELQKIKISNSGVAKYYDRKTFNND